MEGRRLTVGVIVAGAAGVVLGRALFAVAARSRGASGTIGTVWGAMLLVPLTVSVLLLGASIWYRRRSETKALLTTVGLAIVVAMFTVNDFVDGDPAWNRGYGPTRQIASWMVIVSTVAVLGGVVWTVALRYGDDSSAVWWRRPWALAAGCVIVLVFAGGVNASLFGDEGFAPAANEVADDGPPPTIPDAWDIARDGDAPGSYIFSMVRTFRPLDATNVESVHGRFVWPDTELDVCGVSVLSVGDGSVQVGIVSPTTEGCPGMLPMFAERGVPDTACLVVRTATGDDEYCAPLRQD